MLIEITNKERKIVEHLGSALNSGVVHTNDLRNLLDGIRRKIENDTAVSPKRTPKKQLRKDKYRNKINL